ncbi:MAG: SagB/ThcOx family dehydrogenase [Ideonella sp.]|nr:SagB/ThcOx family dehydrogenase [Ideonella sp.]
MNTLTKLALGLLGRVQPRPASAGIAEPLALPPPRREGGLPLMQTLQRRQSQREFDPRDVDAQALSDLLWAVAGINRPDLGGRTAPSALNAQEVEVLLARRDGVFRYDPPTHGLRRTHDLDVRALTGYQDFIDTAPLDLIYIADHGRLKLVPAAQRSAYAYTAAGAMAQNAYLCCASSGLATVLRAWIDRGALARALGLDGDHEVLLCQTVGYPPSAGTSATP